MKQKALKLEFFNASGDLVPELSCCPADMHQVSAAILFLGDANSFKVSVIDLEKSDL